MTARVCGRSSDALQIQIKAVQDRVMMCKTRSGFPPSLAPSLPSFLVPFHSFLPAPLPSFHSFHFLPSLPPSFLSPWRVRQEPGRCSSGDPRYHFGRESMGQNHISNDAVLVGFVFCRPATSLFSRLLRTVISMGFYAEIFHVDGFLAELSRPFWLVLLLSC